MQILNSGSSLKASKPKLNLDLFMGKPQSSHVPAIKVSNVIVHLKRQENQ
jgi:hypothetical protein